MMEGAPLYGSQASTLYYGIDRGGGAVLDSGRPGSQASTTPSLLPGLPGVRTKRRPPELASHKRQ